MKRKDLVLGAVFLFAALLVVLRFTPLGEQGLAFLAGQSNLFILLVLAAALVDSINPCAFSVLLVTIAFLFSLEQTRGRVLLFGGTYIAGIFAAYLLIGLGVLRALALFHVPNFIAQVTAVLLVGIGILELGSSLFPRFPVRFKIPESAHRFIALLMSKRSLPAVFLVGALVGVSEFPCTGGPYLVILSLLYVSDTFVQGAWYLVFYNLVFVAPLIAILLVASDASLVERVRLWRREHTSRARFFEGVFLTLLGLAILLFVY